MPNLDTHKSQNVQRILLVGDPGSGKTTAIGHLLEHGQKLFVADFDDGLDPIRHFVPSEFHKNLVYETLVDKVKPDPTTGFPITKGQPTAFRKFIKLMHNWTDSDTGLDYGPPESWGPDCWLVIDTLTSLGKAVMMYTLSQANRLGQSRRKNDWGNAINRVEGTVDALKSLPVNCIMNAHLQRLTPPDNDDEEKKQSKEISRVLPKNFLMRYPATLGQKLPPQIAGYFNIVIQAQRVGTGRAATRILKTVPDDDVDIKIPLPFGKIKDVELPINKLYHIIETMRKVN